MIQIRVKSFLLLKGMLLFVSVIFNNKYYANCFFVYDAFVYNYDVKKRVNIIISYNILFFFLLFNYFLSNWFFQIIILIHLIRLNGSSHSDT